jgi:hypothetical protein
VGEVRVWAEGPIPPHSDFGDPDCCGTLWSVIRDERPETGGIVYNECAAVVRTVAVGDLQRTLDEMEATLDVCSTQCPLHTPSFAHP